MQLILVTVNENKLCHGVDRRVILKWEGGHLLDWSDSGMEQVAGYCECGNELRVSKTAENFLTS